MSKDSLRVLLPSVKHVQFMGVQRSLRYLFNNLIWLVIIAMFKKENFIAPLIELTKIFNQVGYDEFYCRNMRISHVLKLASKLTEYFYRFNESEEEFKERFRNILNPGDLEKLLELRKKVDIRLIKCYVINLKVTIRDLAERVCKMLDDSEMEDLRGSKYFNPFLYETCDFCGCQIVPDVNECSFRECSKCKDKCWELCSHFPILPLE